MWARTGTAAAVAVAMGGLVLLGGCSDKELKGEMAELRGVTADLSAKAVRPEAEDAFARKGHPVAGKLSCAHDTESETSKDAVLKVNVECTGTGKDDEDLSLTGTLDPKRMSEQKDDDYGIPGHFVGNLNGKKLFTTTCFNCKPG